MNTSRDYLNWIRQLLLSLFFALSLLVFNGCAKNEDLCGYDVQLILPEFQPEGEDLLIVIDELAQKPFNTNYTLSIPNHDGLSLDNGKINFYQKGHESFEFLIEEFDIRDVGLYYLFVSTGYDHCEPFYVEKVVNLEPAVSPCEDLPENVLFMQESEEADPVAIEYLPNIYGYEEPSDEFSIELSEGPFSDFSIVIDFNRTIPEQSNRYKGLSGNGESVHDFDFDNWTHCDIHYYESGYSISTFSISNEDQYIYLVRDENQLRIDFCKLKFEGAGGLLNRFVSTEMVLDL